VCKAVHLLFQIFPLAPPHLCTCSKNAYTHYCAQMARHTRRDPRPKATLPPTIGTRRILVPLTLIHTSAHLYT
jgi:hypothetical protein